MAGGEELLFFFIRHIGQDQAIDADLLAGGDKFLAAIGKNHVGVGHEHHGDGDILAQFADEIKNFISGHATLQCAQVGPLDDRALGGGVGERDAQLNQISPVGGHGADGCGGGSQVGVAAGDERDKRLAVGKSFGDVTHGYPPLCSGQWRRSPCRRGPKW